MVKPIATISVVPNLPEALKRLEELAYNLRWSWDQETIALFRRMDRELWEETTHNPVAMLGQISQSRLEALCDDPAFMAHYRRVCDEFDAYMNPTSTWFSETYGNLPEPPLIAYFSTEFGLTECLQNYSGGLGVLSGDHLKSASDLGIPLVGVGLLYQEGYFHQYLNNDGYQQETYPLNDFATLPLRLVHDTNGKPLTISVSLPGRELYARIWRVQVGRVPLYLLDSNIPDNLREEDRNLTDRLYGGDRRTRIRQEILMGIGGIRALDALGLHPTICHMNEGHSAFLALERIRYFMQQHKATFQQARIITSASNLFTTHTPVPAGLERFGYDLIREHFFETGYHTQLGLSEADFIDLGRENMGDYELFSMPVLALKLSAMTNGVARLHGRVSRQMWQWMFPQIPQAEIPVTSITNGIHVQTWISNEMSQIFDRYLDPGWRREEWRKDIWSNVDLIPDPELWRVHERRRERLVTFARRRVERQLRHRGAPQNEIQHAAEILNPDALTIGFARRFATYKRATLLFRDPERLARILNNPERPVQIIFAGKAHPHDQPGKDLIRQIANLSRQPEFRDHVVFLEDYDMHIARYLVQGVDVWLNTPRRPKEASGTSGMKVIYNGGLNCSILDGWWDEAYSPIVGWAIGNGEEYSEHDADLQDKIESEALYNILEKDLIPLFYDRGRDGIPHNWIMKIKAALRELAPYFNTHRMLIEYTDRMYMPNAVAAMKLAEDRYANGLKYAAWRSKVESAWGKVEIRDVSISSQTVKVGENMQVTALVKLDQLTPDDVSVEVFYGRLDTRGEFKSGESVPMLASGPGPDGTQRFEASLKYHTSGDRGVSVRVLPKHPLLASPFQPGIIRWANGSVGQ
jgi:starch phosphorylase